MLVGSVRRPPVSFTLCSAKMSPANLISVLAALYMNAGHAAGSSECGWFGPTGTTALLPDVPTPLNIDLDH